MLHAEQGEFLAQERESARHPVAEIHQLCDEVVSDVGSYVHAEAKPGRERPQGLRGVIPRDGLVLQQPLPHVKVGLFEILACLREGPVELPDHEELQVVYG